MKKTSPLLCFIISLQKKKRKKNKEMVKEKEVNENISMKNAVSGIRFTLARHDRRILKLFFGYLSLKDGRQASKSKQDACNFVKQALWHEDDGDNDAFCLDTELDWVSLDGLGGIFSKDRTDIQKFLLSGDNLTDIDQCAYIRSYQTFGRSLPEDILVGNNSSYLIILLLGKVSGRQRDKIVAHLLSDLETLSRPQRA